MFEWIIDSSLTPSLLIIIGILLMLGEVIIVGTFVLFWIALAFILMGLYSLYQPLDWRLQLVIITTLGGLFTWLLNPYLKKSKHTHEADSFSPQKAHGYGRLHQDKNGEYSVFYRGTYWLIDPQTPPQAPQNGTEVVILGVNGNYVSIQEKDKAES